jgi:membrane-bound serine protease (ClpP class)
MTRPFSIKLFLLLFTFFLFSMRLFAAAPQVSLLKVDGAINPAVADYLLRNLKESATRGDPLLLVEMDTPGGLDSSMREIVKGILASPVPVAVYVSPSGARAASAGAVIALSAHICAMAPGTNMGAAHPVAIGEQPDKVMAEKLLNDAEAYVEGIAGKRGRNIEIAKKMVRESLSIPAEKALAEHVIDFVASDRRDLINKLEGRQITVAGRETVLRLRGAEIVPHDMGTRERILDLIGDPNVAYVLMMIGMMGIFFELSNPGVILPGVIGGISLILALFAFQTLPVNYAGVLLIILAIILFIAEIKIISHGMLTVGGVIAMILGSLMLFESPEPYLRLSWSVILPTVLMTTIFFVFAVTKVVKAHKRKPVTGGEGLTGEEGRADTDIIPEGKVFVRGEYWDAESAVPILKGDKIVVASVEGMRLKVIKKS